MRGFVLPGRRNPVRSSAATHRIRPQASVSPAPGQACRETSPASPPPRPSSCAVLLAVADAANMASNLWARNAQAAACAADPGGARLGGALSGAGHHGRRVSGMYLSRHDCWSSAGNVRWWVKTHSRRVRARQLAAIYAQCACGTEAPPTTSSCTHSDNSVRWSSSVGFVGAGGYMAGSVYSSPKSAGGHGDV